MSTTAPEADALRAYALAAGFTTRLDDATLLDWEREQWVVVGRELLRLQARRDAAVELCARTCDARAEQYDALLEPSDSTRAYAAEARECAATVRLLK